MALQQWTMRYSVVHNINYILQYILENLPLAQFDQLQNYSELTGLQYL